MTRLVLRRPVSAVLVIIAIVVFGVTAIFGFNLEMLPAIDMPMLAVVVVYPGAAADVVEDQVVKKMETACAGLSGLDSYIAYSYENYCTVLYTFEYDSNVDNCYADLTRALDQADFPDGVEEPTIMEVAMDSEALVSVAAQAEDSSRLLTLIKDEIEPALNALSGVARVEISGGSEEYIRIRLNEQAMAQYRMNISDIAQFIGAADFSVPAGKLAKGARDVPVSVSASLASLEDIRNISLITGYGSQISLADVAEISFAQSDPDSISRYNGEDSITIDIWKVQSAASVAVADEVLAVFSSFGQSGGLQFEVINNTGDTIMDVINTVVTTLAIGAVLAMVIIFLFFGDFKASLIVGSSMPVSVLLTLCVMYLLGFTMHLMTGIGLVIAIGMIVDNSIIVIDNCFRYRKEGLSFMEAARQGANTVLMSITASTITTCVVYLPLGLMSGFAGQFTKEFGFTVIFCMVSSLLSAITVVPLLFNKLQPKEKENLPIARLIDRVTKSYRRFMPKLMKHNALAVGVSVVVLVASLLLASTLNFEMIPAMYDGSIIVEAAFRSGTTLEAIDQEIAVIEQALLEDPLFDVVNMTITGNVATFNAYSGNERARSSEEAVEAYTEAFSAVANMDITILGAGGNTGTLSNFISPYTVINLQGMDLQQLTEVSETVQAELQKVPGVIKVNSSVSEKATQARIEIDPLKAMHVALTPAQVAVEIYYSLSGVEVITATLNGDDYAVTLEYPEGAYLNETDLLNKTLTTGFDTVISLSEIAEITYDDILQSRERTDGKYQIALSAIPMASQRDVVSGAVKAAVDGIALPEGVTQARSAYDTMVYDEISAVVIALGFGVFLVFLAMAMQFESPRFSLMVMVSIPFSLIGSAIMLVITNSILSLVSLIGIMTLVGTVVNNGILFVDTANQLKKGMPVREALVESGAIRLRPILMTTLTTVIAMVPMALESSGNAGMMSGLGIVCIGGLITSTLLILLFMPNFYLLVAGKKAATLGLDAEELEQLRLEEKKKKQERKETEKGTEKA